MIVNKEYLEELLEIAPEHPPYIPAECLKYGSNETGGMRYNKETRQWEDHCHGYEEE